MTLPHISVICRARSDLARCVAFVARHPWGKPVERKLEIYRAFERIREFPELRRVEARRRDGAVELRRYGIAQFIIIYTYFRPSGRFADGLVSIRAIRHRRERKLFEGVREPDPPPYLGGFSAT